MPKWSRLSPFCYQLIFIPKHCLAFSVITLGYGIVFAGNGAPEEDDPASHLIPEQPALV